MSFTMFDANTLENVVAFKGSKGKGYVMFSSGKKFLYKVFDKGIHDKASEFIVSSNDPIVQVSAYYNKYEKEVSFAYQTDKNEIYHGIIQETTNGKLFMDKLDVKVVDNAKEPIIVFDYYANSYFIFYINILNNKMYQGLLFPYDTLLASIIIDHDVVLDTQPIFGSDFRKISLASTQLSVNSFSDTMVLDTGLTYTFSTAGPIFKQGTCSISWERSSVPNSVIDNSEGVFEEHTDIDNIISEIDYRNGTVSVTFINTPDGVPTIDYEAGYYNMYNVSYDNSGNKTFIL